MSGFVGAPGSVARYLSEHDFGDNKFVVLERVRGGLVLRAAQSTLTGAESFWRADSALLLVDVVNCWIIAGGAA